MDKIIEMDNQDEFGLSICSDDYGLRAGMWCLICVK